MQFKKTFKSLTAIIIVLAMMFSLLPVSVMAEDENAAPTSIEIGHNADMIDEKVVAKKGDKFKLTAYDQNGNETPVTWKTSSSGVTIDANTGEIEVTAELSSGGTSYLYFTATSTLDETISREITVQATGYLFGSYQKNQTVELSEDGQTAKTVYITGGVNGHNIWSYDETSKVAKPAKELGNASAITLNALRPGQFEISFKIDENEMLADTATVTVTGVAVEDSEGNLAKTYISMGKENPAPTMQLTAYTAEGRTISSWTSANEAVAAVDENGVVTAKSVGSTIISATDSEGTKGGIKVVVTSEDIPYFESLEFSTTAFTSGTWVKDQTFAPTKLSYELPIRTYSTSSLILQAATLYDAEKYTATAEYTNINGEEQSVEVKNGAMTTLPNQPFGDSVITITLADKEAVDNKTVYTFNVSRPRDTTKAIKNSGITLVPTGRAVSQTTYNGVAEGAMQRADETGTPTSGTGVSSSYNYYRTFIFDDTESYKLNIASSTVYAHIRYSTDGGTTWTETAQGGGLTSEIALPESSASEILIQIIDDAAYTANANAGNDGFHEVTSTEYKVWVDKVTASVPKILTAATDSGDWYPAFDSEHYSYWIVTENGAEAPTLTYTAEDGAEVKIGTTVQTPDENGNYTLTLAASQTSVTVTSGSFANTYKFGNKKKSALDVPDKVVDYLCIGSQYTNGGYGSNPEQTLGGTMKSLGNFGGYITYYYEDPITDNPNNKYGIDFYVTGNSMETNIDSMAELGQVYVSEDGNTWYALAGSEHYEDKAIWDYTITYTKSDDGKSYWTDNQGNEIDYTARNWPLASIYYMNNTANEDSYTFTGVLFKSQLGTVMGDSSSNASYASNAKFGYSDYYATNVSGTVLNDVNPYVEKPSKANGFDVAWAVDENGMPIDVSEKEFHYIRVATASNISAGSFFEKSTEVTYVARTTAQESVVGKTTAPASIIVSDGVNSKEIALTDAQTVYPVELINAESASVTVNAVADDNIYINNQRIASGDTVSGFELADDGEKLVRVIVQNGDKEPVIYMLSLSSVTVTNAESVALSAESTELEIGGTLAFTAKVVPENADVIYEWSSTDTAVATINENGTVTGVSAGEATITVTAKNTDGTAVTDSCVVTVTEPKTYEPITVYLTISDDGDFAVSPVTGEKMARIPVEVPYFDLKDYGMETYYRYEADTFENGGAYINKTVVEQPTVLHLLIKAAEEYYLNGKYSKENNKDALEVSGGATSAYMTKYWGHGSNMMYMVNHSYPEMSAGWGATIDYILLEGGMEIEIGMFSNMNFYNEGYFAYFANGHEIAATTGEAVEFLVMGAPTNTWNGNDPVTLDNESISVYYGTDADCISNGTKAADFEENGTFTLTFDEAGTYYIAAYDNYAGTGDSCIVPAISKVIVTGDAITEPQIAITENGVEVNGIKESCALIVADYTNDVMTDCKIIIASENREYTFEEIGLKTGNSIKAFLWDSTEGLVPLCGYAVYAAAE